MRSVPGTRVVLMMMALLLFAGCKKKAAPVVYRAVPVEQRDIIVSAQAAGAIQPDTTVEVKSKASGEVLQLNAETGQLVKRGAPLVRIDPRNARNTLEQAQADLDVAQAKLTNATSQKRRADEPTGNLDSGTSEEIMGLFEALFREGQTILLVTHEADIAAHALRQVHLKDGRVELDFATAGRMG